MSEIIENIEKIAEGVYKYNLVKTTTNQTTLEALNYEKDEIEKRLIVINYILEEIAKIAKTPV